jgi:5-methylcytosine-specific restriction endonuclease McrA
MSEQSIPAHTQRQLSSKPCVVCGQFIPRMKPSRLAKRIVCSIACRTAYQTGNQNPNWQGGPVLVNCRRCGREFSVCRAASSNRIHCGKECSSSELKGKYVGEKSPVWKGGKHLHKKRHREKKRAAAGLSPSKHVSQPAIRICKGCGKDGVLKGRAYHLECRPNPRSGAARWACTDCGISRKMRVNPDRPIKRCKSCEIKRRKGPGNSNWKGGITPENKRLRASQAYKDWRTDVFQRDNYTCVWCGQRGGQLNADHIQPFSTHPHLRFEVSNGRTLCVPCHQKTSTYLAGALRGRRKQSS